MTSSIQRTCAKSLRIALVATDLSIPQVHGICERPRFSVSIVRQLFIGLIVVGLSGFSVCKVSGQSSSGLRLEPDTLYFSNRVSADNTVRIWNTSDEAVTIDSLRFSQSPPASDNGWGLSLILADTSYSLAYAFSELEDQYRFPDISLEQDTLVIVFEGFDECLVCKVSDMGSASYSVRDTLFTYYQSLPTEPRTVPIDFSRYVSVERSANPTGLSIVAYPNPSLTRATVRVVAGRTGSHEVVIYNLLGQQLSQKHMYMVEGQSYEFAWPGASDLMPSGMFFMRFTDGRVSNTISLILSR